MATRANSFPVFITAKADGSTVVEVNKFRDLMTNALGPIEQKFARIGQNVKFDTSGPKAQLTDLDRALDALRSKLTAGPLKIPSIELDPRGIASAATAAQAFAREQRAIAAAAAVAAADVARATEMTRQYAAAASAAADAAEAEAARQVALADTHRQVAAAMATAAGGTRAFATTQTVLGAGARNNQFAMVQLSQQAQDFAIQIQGGQRPLVAFSQQLSQAAFIASSMGGSLGGVGRFLAGPWGTALVLGASAVGLFASKLGDATDAAQAAKIGADGLSDAQSVLGGIFDLTSGKIEKQNALLIANARLTAINLRAEALAQRQSSQGIFGTAGSRSVGGTLGAVFSRSGGTPLSRLQFVGSNASEQSQLVAAIRAAGDDDKKLSAAIDNALKRSEKLDFRGTSVSKTQFQQAIIDFASSRAKDRVAGEIDKSLNSGVLAAGLRRDGRAKKGRDTGSRVAGLEEFGRDAADKIANIQAPFTDEPKLLQQVSKALKEVDDVTRGIVAKNVELIRLTGHGLPQYNELIASAKAAIATISDAPVTKIGLMTRELQDQQKIQALIAQGRPGEAAALEAKMAILRQIGATLDQEPEKIKAALAEYEKQREALAQTRADAEAATTVRQIGQSNEILRAELSGRADLAELLREQFRLEQDGAHLGADQLANLQRQLEANHALSREMENYNRSVQRAVQSANVLQDAITGIVMDPFDLGSWKSALKSIMGDFRSAFAENITRGLFGDLGADLEDAMRRRSDPLGAAGADLTSSAGRMETSADRLIEAASDLKGAAAAISTSANGNAGPTIGEVTTTPTAFGGALGAVAAVAGRANGLAFLHPILDALQDQPQQPVEGDEIVITARREQLKAAKESIAQQAKNPLISNPTQYYNLLGKSVGTSIDKLLGTSFFGKIGGKLGTLLEGATIGQAVGGLPGLLGLKTSNLGSQIGGALGGAIAGPIGSVVGGLLGSIFGGLFKKTKKASTTISGGEFGGFTEVTGGNSAKRETATAKLAAGIENSLEQLAGSLGTLVDASLGAVSIGIRDKKFVVDPTGQGRTKGPGVLKFGEDEQAAVEAAMRDLIQDGVLGPIHESTKRILLAGGDLQRAINKAVKLENVFIDLKKHLDPVGAAIDEVNRKFEELRRIAAEGKASAEELAQIEQEFAFERADAIKAAAKQMSGTLQDLLNDLTFKGDNGLSLRTREANARQAFNPLAAQVRAGQIVDQEAFADAARSLLDIERQIYGSQSQYFAALTEVTSLTQQAIRNSGGIPNIVVPGVQAPTYGTVAPSAIPGALGTAVPGATPTQQAANDNAYLAAQIASQFKQQTEALIKYLPDDGRIVTAIQAALLGISLKDGLFGLRPTEDILAAARAGTGGAEAAGAIGTGGLATGVIGSGGGGGGIRIGGVAADEADPNQPASLQQRVVDLLEKILGVGKEGNEIANEGFSLVASSSGKPIQYDYAGRPIESVVKMASGSGF